MASFIFVLLFLTSSIWARPRALNTDSTLYPLLDFFLDVSLYAPLQGTTDAGPQVFHQEGFVIGERFLKLIVGELKRDGFSCEAREAELVCDPSIGFDTIDARCYYDPLGIMYCSTAVYNRQYDYTFHFQFRNQKACQNPQVWNRLGAKINLDLQGEPMQLFLAELNAQGYDCTGDYNTFSCANPIPYDTIKGSCVGTLSIQDPVKCQVDKIYNHFTLKKLVPCLYPKSKE